jgi:hypothetical protein
VSNPEEILRELVSFLELDWDEGILTKSFRSPNSSYKDLHSSGGISSRSLDRWRDILPYDIILEVEACCLPEMSKLGYLKQDMNEGPTKFPGSGGPIDYQSLSPWCKELVGTRSHYENEWTKKNNEIEKRRFCLYQDFSLGDEDEIEAYFFKTEYFKWLRHGS